MEQIEENLKRSFFISYLILFSLTVITFIEAIRTPSRKIRNILNLETAISLVAGYVYYIFVSRIAENNITLKEITRLRYYDWCITTPMLLLVIMIFFGFEQSKLVSLHIYMLAIAFNYLMLLFGYLGETGRINKIVGCGVGFIFFAALIATIWFGFFSSNRVTVREYIIFGLFTIVWSLYGVAYLLDDVTKNRMYNTLDVIAKAFFGVFMWVYYNNIFTA